MLVKSKIHIEYFSPLSADNLFGELPPKLRIQFDSLKKTKRFPKPQIIYEAGETTRGFYILLDGRIRLRPDSSRSGYLFEQPAIFGLTETIADIPYEMTVEALTPCVCEYVGGEDFIRFLRGEPKFSFSLLRHLAPDLQKRHKTLFTSTV